MMGAVVILARLRPSPVLVTAQRFRIPHPCPQIFQSPATEGAGLVPACGCKTTMPAVVYRAASSLPPVRQVFRPYSAPDTPSRVAPAFQSAPSLSPRHHQLQRHVRRRPLSVHRPYTSLALTWTIARAVTACRYADAWLVDPVAGSDAAADRSRDCRVLGGTVSHRSDASVGYDRHPDTNEDLYARFQSSTRLRIRRSDVYSDAEDKPDDHTDANAATTTRGVCSNPVRRGLCHACSVYARHRLSAVRCKGNMRSRLQHVRLRHQPADTSANTHVRRMRAQLR